MDEFVLYMFLLALSHVRIQIAFKFVISSFDAEFYKFTMLRHNLYMTFQYHLKNIYQF